LGEPKAFLPDSGTGGNTCVGGQDCVPGHICINGDGGPDRCALQCDDDECLRLDPSWQCSSAQGACKSVECGRKIACSTAEFCDLSLFRCYPTSGACSTVSDCPVFGLVDGVELSCTSGSCVLNRPSPSFVSGLDTRGVVEVLSPTPGQEFANEGEVAFQWTAVNAPVLVVVADAEPTTLDKLRAHAVWGFAGKSDEAGVIHWANGVHVTAAGWNGVPAEPPQEVPLFVVVQAVQRGVLLGASRAVPFSIGKAWKTEGDSCEDQGVVNGSCANPARVLVCNSGQCRVACASNLDCSSESGCAITPSLTSFAVCDLPPP